MCVKIAPKQNVLDWTVSEMAESEQESAWILPPHQIQFTPRSGLTILSLRKPKMPSPLLDSVSVLYTMIQQYLSLES